MLPITEVQDVKCPECGVKGIYDHGEIVCPECGLVIRDVVLDRGPIREENNGSNRISYNPTSSDIYPLKGVGSKIGSGRYRDAKSDYVFSLMWNNKRTRDTYCSQALRGGLVDLRYACSNLNLPTYGVESAAIYYRKLSEDEWLKGRVRKNVFAGIMMVVCREYNLIRTPEEIAEGVGLSGGNKSSLIVLNYYKKISKILGKKERPFDSTDYTKKLCNDFNILGEKRKFVLNISENMKGVGGYNPRCIASAVFYILVKKENLDITQSTIAEKMNISCVSIRNRYREIAEKFNIGFD